MLYVSQIQLILLKESVTLGGLVVSENVYFNILINMIISCYKYNRKQYLNYCLEEGIWNKVLFKVPDFVLGISSYSEE